MANPEHLKLLESGLEEWNRWRIINPDTLPDLRKVNLMGQYLVGIDLIEVNLQDANLSGTILTGAKLNEANLAFSSLENSTIVNADLTGANLRYADLNGANLEKSKLINTNLEHASLVNANLANTNLAHAKFSYAKIDEADFSDCFFRGTQLNNINLTPVNGLESVVHAGPSMIDYYTIVNSWPLPVVFLRGIGFPDNWIDNIPALLAKPLQYFKAFISYSHKDMDFVERLHADLQNSGVRCWRDKKDLLPGDMLGSKIPETIRLREKIILILSQNSIESEWVAEEVEAAMEKETARNHVIIPLSIDDAFLNTDIEWARSLKRRRHISDFSNWKSDHIAYKAEFEKLLKALTHKPEK